MENSQPSTWTREADKAFTWTREADKAFEEMKKYIEKLPMLAIKLVEHGIEFKHRNTVKAQILAEFLAETKEEDEEKDFQEQQQTKKNIGWKLYTCGASSGKGSRAGLMVVSPEGTKFTYALKFEFIATNNETEYEAVIAGLRIAKEMKIEEITIFVDSQLVANQQIAEATLEEEDNWMTPIMKYLVSGSLPADKKLARKIKVKSLNYRIIEGILYKRSFLTPCLRCIGPKQARNVIKEIHEGSCDLYAGPRSIIEKITTLGYYWPYMHKDSLEIIQSCDACQIHSLVSRLPKKDMTLGTAAWPFIQWGIDLVGPGKVKFLIVVVDYFTKWVEAKPLSNVTRKHVERFVWEHIVCCFRIPQMIIFNNGKQFDEEVFP
ncbi:reverse transcriptase domain-containing protein [Tanacetum coccineum]